MGTSCVSAVYNSRMTHGRVRTFLLWRITRVSESSTCWRSRRKSWRLSVYGRKKRGWKGNDDAMSKYKQAMREKKVPRIEDSD